MPSPTTNDEFLELVRKSGVVDDKKLTTYLDKVRAAQPLPSTPAALAGLLVRDGLLTHFQAEQFLQGKWRRFSLGKYKVLERLGAGGMGTVYLCEHKLMRRRVAVKVLPAAKAEDASSLERFYREARAVAALDHPNIVRAYDIDQDDKLHFLVMEHVDGASLQEIVKKTGPMDVLRACHYMRQAALGLQHAARKRRHRSPRHQAGQHPRRSQRHRQNPRHGTGTLLPRRRRRADEKVRGKRAGHRRLSGAGAGAGQSFGGHPRGHLQSRRHVLFLSDGADAVRRRFGGAEIDLASNAATQADSSAAAGDAGRGNGARGKDDGQRSQSASADAAGSGRDADAVDANAHPAAAGK